MTERQSTPGFAAGNFRWLAVFTLDQSTELVAPLIETTIDHYDRF